VTSAAPLWATASASSGTVALSPRSSAFNGSRTAARSFVCVGARGGTKRPPARVAQARSSSLGNLALRLPRVVASAIAAEAIAADAIALSNTQDNTRTAYRSLAKQACWRFRTHNLTLVCHHASLKSQDWFLRGGMRLVAMLSLSFEGGRVNWRPLHAEGIGNCSCPNGERGSIASVALYAKRSKPLRSDRSASHSSNDATTTKHPAAAQHSERPGPAVEAAAMFQSASVPRELPR
jgi:hypothetical protein